MATHPSSEVALQWRSGKSKLLCKLASYAAFLTMIIRQEGTMPSRKVCIEVYIPCTSMRT